MCCYFLLPAFFWQVHRLCCSSHPPATFMTHPFTPLLILLLAVSYLLMVYFIFVIVQRVISRREQMLK